MKKTNRSLSRGGLVVDALCGGGIWLLLWGLWLMWPPLLYVATGAILMTCGILLAMTKRD